MCGIAGIVALGGATPTRADLVRMCDSMVHRGPDDDGYLVDGQVGLGMRRLSIIDLARGHQPIYNEDGTVAVVLNGEIYNYRELRGWLKSRGHQFRTDSDTEVVVHLWEEVGEDFPNHLNGMFAIALYDQRQRRVVLVRDHAGIKPLYYVLGPDGLVFASEIKAILEVPWVERRLDVDALAQFLAWEYTPGPATLLRDVRRLEPGRMLSMDLGSGQASIRRYWQPSRSVQDAGARTAREWEDEADEVIRRSVQRQLVADVPVGAFLSGGVDSTLVVAAMGNARTYSIGFEDASYDETRWAVEVARRLGVRNHVEVMRPDVVEMFDHLMHHLDDPIADSSIFPSFLVSRLASRDVKVVMSGEGGDELFGGYETFIAEERFRSWRRIPKWLRTGLIEPVIDAWPPTERKKGFINKAKRFVEGARLEASLGHARWRMFMDEATRDQLLTAGARRLLTTNLESHIRALRQEAGKGDGRLQALQIDFSSYLVDNCLTKVDRMSMACSIEARVPFLDREVIELAFRIPSELKYDGCRSKILLKRVAARYVPRRIAARPKEGFSAPVKHWMRGPLREMMEQFLAPARLRREGLFEPDVVQRLWSEHLDGRANHSHLLWSLLIFQQWRERWRVNL